MILMPPTRIMLSWKTVGALLGLLIGMLGFVAGTAAKAQSMNDALESHSKALDRHELEIRAILQLASDTRSEISAIKAILAHMEGNR